MACTVEILRGNPKASIKSDAMLKAMEGAIQEAGDSVRCTNRYEGKSDWLVLFGVGAQAHAVARDKQLRRGRTLMFDMAYVNREDRYFRMSIDFDHPHEWMDRTPTNPERWASFDVALKNEANPDGKILLIGMGRKSRAYLKMYDWEQKAYIKLKRLHPEKQIIFRPKGDDRTLLPCVRDNKTPIEELIKGASLVYARHSNCCVDAIISGVPFECEDGAAKWVLDTGADREDFLSRLGYWQWKGAEAGAAWQFAKDIVK